MFLVSNLLRKKSRASGAKKRLSVRPQMERLEERSLMAATVQVLDADYTASSGDASLNELYGLQRPDDQIVYRIRVTGTELRDEVEVNMAGNSPVFTIKSGSEPVQTIDLGRDWTYYHPTLVIEFLGHGGDDRFINNTRFETMAMGGAGNDYLEGGYGPNYLDGGNDADTLIAKQQDVYSRYVRRNWVLNQFIVNRMVGGPGNDIIKGGPEDDMIAGGEGDDSIWGLGGNDWIHGDEGDDVIKGGSGDDRIFGNDGNDRLYGGSGRDLIDGGAGWDYLDGGNDDVRDKLLGGTGRDIFVIYPDKSSEAFDSYTDKNSNEGDTSYNLIPQGNGQYKYPALEQWLYVNMLNTSDLVRGGSTWAFTSETSVTSYTTYVPYTTYMVASGGSTSGLYSSYMVAGGGTWVTTYNPVVVQTAVTTWYVTDFGDGDIGALVLNAAPANPAWLSSSTLPDVALALGTRDLDPLDSLFRETLVAQPQAPLAFQQQKRPLVFTDADGDTYTVKLTGPGELSVVLLNPDANGRGAIDQIIVHGTDPRKSSLAVTVKKASAGDGIVNIGEIQGSGLKSIQAKSADLVGAGIDLSGLLGSLTIRDVENGADITARGTALQKTTISAHVIGAGTHIKLDSTIGALTVSTFGDGSVSAPAIGKLNVTGDSRLGIAGDLNADLTLTGTGDPRKPTLTSAKIQGGISDAVWRILGNNTAKSVTINGGVSGWRFLADEGTIAALAVTGTTSATTPAFSNSDVLARNIGRVKLASVATENAGTPFGIRATNSLGSVTAAAPAFVYDATDPNPQGLGDFVVELAE